MDWFILVLSACMLIALRMAHRLGGGSLSLPFLIMLYITLLYFGALHFFFEDNHYTFVFVFGMAVFFVIGLHLANGKTNQFPNPLLVNSLKLYVPVNPNVLQIALFAIFLLALFVAFYRLYLFGSPLLSQTWYTGAIESSTGVVNRLVFSFGVMTLGLASLLSFGLHKAQDKRTHLYMALLFFVFYVFFKVINGGKSAAILPFLIAGMAIFYCDRSVPRKFWVATSIFVVSLALYVGSFWTGVFSTSQIFMLFYDRVTSLAAVHVDYLLYDWANEHSWQFGNTIFLEIKRLVAQITPLHKEPLFNEMIGNLRSGALASKVTGISPELSLFGMGFANFGFPGAVASAILFGFVVQRINLFLLSVNRLNLFSFVLWIYFTFQLLGFARAGNFIIMTENFLIEIIPAFVVIAIGYLTFALPFPSALRWQRLPVSHP